MYSPAPCLYYADISAAQMDLHTDKAWDISEKCWIWLSSLQAQGLPALLLEPNTLAFFKAWTCMPGFGAGLWLRFCLRARPSFHFSNQIKEYKVTEQEMEPMSRR